MSLKTLAFANGKLWWETYFQITLKIPYKTFT
jgi:hypothetical protein